MVSVRFVTSKGAFKGMLQDDSIAEAIRQKLPIASTVMRWGDEIYFDVPIKLPNEQPTRAVTVGDIAYWPDGPCLCIFFGKTPASKAGEPRPASDVTIIGHTEASPTLLQAIPEGVPIRMMRA